MNAPNTFIVTVQTVDQRFMQDMELPSELPVSELAPKLLEVLKNIAEDEFADCGNIRLEANNRVLSDNDTLVKAGAFDGSRITLLE